MNGGKVFLTGGTGFVGRHVASELLRLGYRLRVLVRPGSEVRLPPDDRVEVVTGEVVQPDDCRRAAEGSSAAVHLVGIIRQTPAATYEAVHVEGTRNVIEACRAHGVDRLVHMSAHGASPTSGAVYLRSKAVAQSLVAESGLRWTIFRPSVILGPDGEFTRLMVKLVSPRWRPVPVLGSGDSILQPLGVDEVGNLVARAVRLPTAEGKTYGLGGPQAVTLNEFLDRLCVALFGHRRVKVHLPMALARPLVSVVEHLMRRPPVTREQLAMLGEARPVDVSQAMKDFQWQPEPLDAVLKRCLEQRRRQ